MASAIFLFRISPEIVTPLRQLSLRGYGNRRFGVTAIVATELRQSSLRGYDNRRNETDKYRCSQTPWIAVFWWLKNDEFVHWQFAELTLKYNLIFERQSVSFEMEICLNSWGGKLKFPELGQAESRKYRVNYRVNIALLSWIFRELNTP